MIIDEMATLWIIMSPADLHNLLVICLAGVELDLRPDVAFVFAYKTATMNPMAIAKFFHMIFKGVLLSLFANGCCDGGLLRPVSTYFGKVKTNGGGMFYFYYLVWLKRASYLLNLCVKI